MPCRPPSSFRVPLGFPERAEASEGVFGDQFLQFILGQDPIAYNDAFRMKIIVRAKLNPPIFFNLDVDDILKPGLKNLLQDWIDRTFLKGQNNKIEFGP